MLIEGTICNRKFYSTNQYSDKDYFVIVVIEWKKGTAVVKGSCNCIPSMGDWLIARGNFEQSKYGETFCGKSVEIHEPRDKKVVFSRLRDMGIVDKDARMYIEKHGDKIWQKIEEKKLGDDPEFNEKIYTKFEPWRRSSPTSTRYRETN